VDSIIILSKIETLKRCIERILSKTPNHKEVLFDDLDLQDIIVLNLQRAVQVSVDLAAHILSETNVQTPLTMAECFIELHRAGVISRSTAERLRKSVSFRNIAVHEYQSLNWDVVYAIITLHLNDFRDYAMEIMAWLEKRGAQDP